MQGVGPGTIIEGRYALRRRVSKESHIERWSAHDTTLEREVVLTIVGPDHPNRAGILDAARRAAGVEDTRLIRILDVSTQVDNSYIVEETLTGAESLAELLLQGSLPAEEARRMSGETASALETARQRGLHHLRLTPHCILRTTDGAIKVSGLAVDAAVSGTEEPDAAAASRRDAVAVVAVAYAALTSRWPLNEQVPGIEPAPRVVGGVPAPSEIAAGVPSDLDALCRMTLNEDTGPLTPGDFASQIAPWSREAVHRVEVVTVEVDPPVALELPRPDSRSTGAPVVGDQTSAPGAHAATAATAAKVVGGALAGAGTVAGAVGGRIGSFARAATDKAAAALGDGALGGERMTLPEALLAHYDEIEPPLPMLPASTAQAPSRDQSKIVVIIVATFVALSLIVGYFGLQSIGQGVKQSGAAPKGAVTASAPPTTATSPAPSAVPEGPAAGQPIAILSATGLDPQGDGNENNAQAARVYDGNPATAWSSEGYNSPALGGLKKGVGLLLDLGQPTSVSQVAIDLAKGPVDLTVYASTTPGLDGATVIGTATAASGHVDLKAASTMPRAQYVIVWFTKLAPDAPWFRAAIAEIALT